jgi:hypothetical protein
MSIHFFDFPNEIHAQCISRFLPVFLVKISSKQLLHGLSYGWHNTTILPNEQSEYYIPNLVSWIHSGGSLQCLETLEPLDCSSTELEDLIISSKPPNLKNLEFEQGGMDLSAVDSILKVCGSSLRRLNIRGVWSEYKARSDNFAELVCLPSMSACTNLRSLCLEPLVRQQLTLPAFAHLQVLEAPSSLICTLQSSDNFLIFLTLLLCSILNWPHVID